jgi:uncharacterized protein
VLKVVVDTNQFVSSLLIKKGLPVRIIDAWRRGTYILVTSNEILEEVSRVLRYPRIQGKYRFQEESIESLVSVVERQAIVLQNPDPVDVIKEDPDDNRILACAIQGKAHYIVSGDPHLLKVRKYQDVTIVTPREFIAILERDP